jgi:hypothetical protein
MPSAAASEYLSLQHLLFNLHGGKITPCAHFRVRVLSLERATQVFPVRRTPHCISGVAQCRRMSVLSPLIRATLKIWTHLLESRLYVV